ncbi:hypothetical protein PI124_g9783 [Phytophthora idaei]|nr:hypothetical protein PI126_g8318 [Phytophthora idaei]KAG3245467.1 hypothetical protein PI124_g9783 [Phytophthora idaei]
MLYSRTSGGRHYWLHLKEFKANNPAWTKLRCALIDKDFTELSVLTTASPDVTILLCQFHVLKYLKEEIASYDYGCNTWEKDQLRGLMNLLVYAKTDKDYMRHFWYMLHVCEVGRSISEQSVQESESSDQVGRNLAPGGENLTTVGRNLETLALDRSGFNGATKQPSETMRDPFGSLF